MGLWHREWVEGGSYGRDERMMGSGGKREWGDNPKDWSHVALAREENSVSL